MTRRRHATLVAGCLTLALAAAAQDPAPPPFTVEVHGEGKPVLLIPGLSSPGSVWDGTVAHLRGTHQLHVLRAPRLIPHRSIGTPIRFPYSVQLPS